MDTNEDIELDTGVFFNRTGPNTGEVFSRPEGCIVATLNWADYDYPYIENLKPSRLYFKALTKIMDLLKNFAVTAYAQQQEADKRKEEFIKRMKG